MQGYGVSARSDHLMIRCYVGAKMLFENATPRLFFLCVLLPFPKILLSDAPFLVSGTGSRKQKQIYFSDKIISLVIWRRRVT